jgi:hypothetical protein
LDILEEHVKNQCRNGTSDLEANLAVLKLYQFNPDLAKEEIIGLILIKALMNLPRNDFVICRCLLRFDNVSRRESAVLRYRAHLLPLRQKDPRGSSEKGVYGRKTQEKNEFVSFFSFYHRSQKSCIA